MESWEIKTILLGYDGSNGAKRAAELAATLARQNNARIVVMTAFPHHSRLLDIAKGRPFVGPAEGEMSPEYVAASDTANELVQQYETAGIGAEAGHIGGPGLGGDTPRGRHPRRRPDRGGTPRARSNGRTTARVHFGIRCEAGEDPGARGPLSRRAHCADMRL